MNESNKRTLKLAMATLCGQGLIVEYYYFLCDSQAFLSVQQWWFTQPFDAAGLQFTFQIGPNSDKSLYCAKSLLRTWIQKTGKEWYPSHHSVISDHISENWRVNDLIWYPNLGLLYYLEL